MSADVTTSGQVAEAPGSGPVGPGERIDSLDTLRGFALLGILVMNIQLFAMPGAAYINPTVWGDLEGMNHLVWLLSHILTDQKMMTIFSMLFGAGIVLFADRAMARGVSPASLHYRRMFWLLLFGLAHAYLLWAGDILFLYAVCAFVVYRFRGLTPARLITVGVATLAVSSIIFIAFGMSMPNWPPEQQAEFIEQSWQPPPEALAAEVEAYRSGWMTQVAYRAPSVLEFQTFYLAIWGFWRAAGLMLIGMALYKLGVLSARAPVRLYAGFIAAAMLVGFPVVGYGVYWNFANDWGPLSFFYGFQFNYWGSLFVSLGWIGLVMLICQSGVLTWLRRRFAAVGRMAFTNYLLHTLICTTVFYGHGLGWFGGVERTGQIAIVAGVCALQLLLSPIWLQYFRSGPFEWLWRSLTYGRAQPWLRASTQQATSMPVR